MTELVELTIDGRTVKVKAGITILQACAEVGIEIPRFCYHERLSVSGNCRMCLVQSANTPKPVASCAMIVEKGMAIQTDSEMVKKAREGVLEFLLANHPLDCPICDQGGECDLQDQVVAFGSDRGRFYEQKRAVADKDCGPIVKTVMTRCIQCTRCVRFITEISGIEQFGLSGRGNRMEIGTYVQQNLTSELSGNIVDLCPVGALTSKPYQFKGRPWELKIVESVDLSDGVGSNTRVDTRGNEILRVLPRMNLAINEEWISDKARHAVVDGSRNQRLDTPMIRFKEATDYEKASWQKIITEVAGKLSVTSGQDIAFYVDTAETDLETMVMVKQLAHSLGSPNLFPYSGTHGYLDLDSTFREDYTCSFAELENADVCLLVGVNPRKEAAMLNVRLRRRVLKGELLVAEVGVSENLTYPSTQLAGTMSVVLQILEGRHLFCKVLAKAKNPIILVGAETLWPDFQHAAMISALGSRFPYLRLLHRTANGAGALDIGFVPGVHASPAFNHPYKVAYVLGGLATANHELMKTLQMADSVIYQGSHGLHILNLTYVVPGALSAIEKQGFFINTEGRVQETKVAVSSSREDWKIIQALMSFIAGNNKLQEEGRKRLIFGKALFASLGRVISLRTLHQIREKLIQKVAPHLAYMHQPAVIDRKWCENIRKQRKIDGIKLHNSNLAPSVLNFYQTDAVSYYSKVMGDCTKMIRENTNNYYKN